MTTAVRHPAISSRRGVCGGKPCIAGTRVRVMDVVALTKRGDSPVEIVDAFPHITLSQVHSALAYYYDHKTEVDASFEEEDGVVAECRRTGPRAV